MTSMVNLNNLRFPRLVGKQAANRPHATLVAFDKYSLGHMIPDGYNGEVKGYPALDMYVTQPAFIVAIDNVPGHSLVTENGGFMLQFEAKAEHRSLTISLSNLQRNDKFQVITVGTTELQIWQLPSSVGHHSVLMTPEDGLEPFKRFLFWSESSYGAYFGVDLIGLG
jgi:hypothetical protein